jgi:hypothetical protein
MSLQIGDICLIVNSEHPNFGDYLQITAKRRTTYIGYFGYLIDPVTLQQRPEYPALFFVESSLRVITAAEHMEPEVPNNLVSLAAWRKSPKADKDTCSFNKIMRSNLDKIARLKKERAKDNKSVIRSYRLKK